MLKTGVHRKRGLVTIVHGDDSCAAGSVATLRWFGGQIRCRLEVATQVAGHPCVHSSLPREVKILHRVVGLIKGGFECETDPRHAELVIEPLGVGHLNGLVAS